MNTQPTEEMPLHGPRAHERHRPEPGSTPDTVRLSDKSPLYHALLDPNALSISAHDVHSAKNRLAVLIEKDPETVMRCQGQTAKDACAILDSIVIEKSPAQPQHDGAHRTEADSGMDGVAA